MAEFTEEEYDYLFKLVIVGKFFYLVIFIFLLGDSGVGTIFLIFLIKKKFNFKKNIFIYFFFLTRKNSNFKPLHS